MRSLIFTLSLCFSLLAYGAQNAKTMCFLVMENNKILKQEGDCQQQISPCSTFKIAISLMGFNEGLLQDETHPNLPFKEGYEDFVAAWRQEQTPASWIKNSCVWYSQEIVKQLGKDKFQHYVNLFQYGNQDISGDKGQNNSLTRSWISSSLKISPIEQMAFLNKLIHEELPLSKQAQQMTKNIIFVEDLPNGWKLYGKTGTGDVINEDGSHDTDGKIGRFVGWLQKGDRIITFAHYTQEYHQDLYVARRARDAAVEKIQGTILAQNTNQKA